MTRNDYHKKFICLWLGQSVSLLGSSITSFALSLWVYEQTKEPGHLALLFFAHLCPKIYFGVFAGFFIDQFNRKTMLQICDISFILLSFILLKVITTHPLSIYLLVFINFIAGVIGCFKALTFQTTVSMFINKPQLLKYNGLVSAIQNSSFLLGPIMGGLLLSLTTMKNIIFIDAASFLIGLMVSTIISFPKIDYKKIKKLEWNQLTFGKNFIFKSKLLKKVLFLFAFENFFSGLSLGLVTAFLLAKTNGDNLLTAYSSSLIALGGIIGGILTAKTAHFIRKPFLLILAGFLTAGFMGRILAGFSESIVLIGLLLMKKNIIIPIVNALCETIWQKETPVEYQGRVFGARRFFAQGGIPIAILIGIGLLNFCFSKESYAVLMFSKYFNTNAEAGQLSIFFIVCGLLEMFCAVLFYLKSRHKI